MKTLWLGILMALFLLPAGGCHWHHARGYGHRYYEHRHGYDHGHYKDNHYRHRKHDKHYDD
jgi:hypothetical protein